MCSAEIVAIQTKSELLPLFMPSSSKIPTFWWNLPALPACTLVFYLVQKAVPIQLRDLHEPGIPPCLPPWNCVGLRRDIQVLLQVFLYQNVIWTMLQPLHKQRLQPWKHHCLEGSFPFTIFEGKIFLVLGVFLHQRKAFYAVMVTYIITKLKQDRQPSGTFIYKIYRLSQYIPGNQRIRPWSIVSPDRGSESFRNSARLGWGTDSNFVICFRVCKLVAWSSWH